MLTQCLGIPHISTGDMLRDRIRSGAEAGRRWRPPCSRARWCPDEVVNEMVEERLSEPDAADGFYPGRVSADAGRRPSTWRSGWSGRGIREVVIHLAVDYNIIIARLTGRRQCPRCGTLYNVVLPPAEGGGSVRSGRGDAGDPGRRSAKP